MPSAGICTSCAVALADALGVPAFEPAGMTGWPPVPGGVNLGGMYAPCTTYGNLGDFSGFIKAGNFVIDYCTWPFWYNNVPAHEHYDPKEKGFQTEFERLTGLNLLDYTLHFDARSLDDPGYQYENALVVEREIVIPWSEKEIYFLSPELFERTTIIPVGKYPEFALTVRTPGTSVVGYYAYIYHDANPTIGIPEAEAYRFVVEDVLEEPPGDGGDGLPKEPGETLLVSANWMYHGPAKVHQVVVELGHYDGAFIGTSGLRWQKDFNEPGSVEPISRSTQVSCPIPIGATPGLYDLEVRCTHLGAAGIISKQLGAVRITGI